MSEPCGRLSPSQHTRGRRRPKSRTGDAPCQADGDPAFPNGIRFRIARNKADRSGETSTTHDAPLVIECDIHMPHRELNDSTISEFVDLLQHEFSVILTNLNVLPADVSSRISRVLTNVDLSDNSLGDHAIEVLMKWFFELGIVVHIRVLKLYKNIIGDDGAKMIARFIGNCQKHPLEELHLSHNKISADGALALLLSFSTATASPSPDTSQLNFIYPRYETSRRLRLPVWIRLEFNNIVDCVSLLRIWTSSVSNQRSRLVGLLSERSANYKNARDTENHCAGLVCFAERIMGQTAIKNSECSPARCGCASNEAAPIMHLFAFRRQTTIGTQKQLFSQNIGTSSTNAAGKLSVVGRPQGLHADSHNVPPMQQREKLNRRRERNSFHRQSMQQQQPSAQQLQHLQQPQELQQPQQPQQRSMIPGPPKERDYKGMKGTSPSAVCADDKESAVSKSGVSPVVGTITSLESSPPIGQPEGRPTSQGDQALPLYIFIDGVALLAMSHRSDWRDPSQPNFFSLPVIYTLCSNGRFGGIIHGTTTQDESQRIIIVVVDIALRQAREIAASNPSLFADFDAFQETLLTSLRVEHGIIEILDVSDVVQKTEVAQQTLRNLHTNRMMEFLEFVSLWSHHVRKIEGRRIANFECAFKGQCMDVSTVAVITVGADNIEFCRRWQSHRHLLRARHPEQRGEMGCVECFELSEINRELDNTVGNILRPYTILSDSIPDESTPFVMNALFMRHIFQAVSRRNGFSSVPIVCPPLGRVAPPATDPPRYRTEPADFPSIVPAYPTACSPDLVRQLREELLSGIALLRELPPCLSTLPEHAVDVERSRCEIFHHIDRWSRLVLASDRSMNVHHRFASNKSAVSETSLKPQEVASPILERSLMTQTSFSAHLDFFPIAPVRASWNPETTSRRQNPNEIPSWLWR